MPEVEAFISVGKQTQLARGTSRFSSEQRDRLAFVLCAMHSKRAHTDPPQIKHSKLKDASSKNTKDFPFAAV
ncbi:hypothetical protein PQQ84_27255 [Paraburkholderia strydomiana]|uniref:hypothetical protein n=1 Tax=Paraburkholderia strydomiana TaxID=1245417 RepID=UPI0038B8B4F1